MRTSSFSFGIDISTGEAMRISGFGACMIAGTPHRLEDSFFWKACSMLHAKTGQPIEVDVNSLIGFSAPKAVNHIGRALRNRPDLTVIQLGSIDVSVNLKAHVLKQFGRIFKTVPGPVHNMLSVQANLVITPFKPKASRRLVDLLKSAACRAMNVKPISGGETIYLPAISNAIDAILASKSVPVILAPFPQADPVNNRWARKYAISLKNLAREKGAVFVDTYHELLELPFERLLLADRLHLSIEGHDLVGRLVATALEKYMAWHNPID